MVRLRDIMTAEVLTVSPGATIREAMELLCQHHVSGAPVVSGGRVVGVVSASDLLAFASTISGVPTSRDFADPLDVDRAALERIDDPEDDGGMVGSAFFTDLWDDAGADVVARVENVDSPEWNALEEHDVSEAMTRLPLCTLPPDADARVAAELMVQRQIHRVLVTQDDGIVGIVSSLDFARAVAEGKFRDGTPKKFKDSPVRCEVAGHSRRP